MEICREKSCSFTGHRPEKLKGNHRIIRQMLSLEIDKAIEKGMDTFISGMAEGVDLWAAEIVLKKKEKNPGLQLVCAVPFLGVEKKRSEEQKKRFHAVIEKADRTEYICPKYERSCFQKRDFWMVDHSGMVLAVFNGTRGGTKMTIDYAKKQGIETVIIEDKAPVICSLCGKAMDVFDLQEQMGKGVDDIFGYGSAYDSCHIRFRLCCSCGDKLINYIRRHGKEDPVICTDVHFAGEMTNDQMKRMNHVLKYLNQEGTDAVIERIGKMNSAEIEKYLQDLEKGFGSC